MNQMIKIEQKGRVLIEIMSRLIATAHSVGCRGLYVGLSGFIDRIPSGI